MIEQKLDRLYEFDQEGLHATTPQWSAEDNDVMSLWEKSITVEDNHLCLPVPWRDESLNLQYNYHLAKHRLDSLKKSLIKKNLVEEYDKGVQQLVNHGYAELVPLHTDVPERCWYIPHHAVPERSGDLRLVFDCSAEYKGKSINNSCLQGPKLTCDLFDILIRFRQFKNAVMADIRHMYNQVKIPRKETAKLASSQHVKDAILGNFYVDDIAYLTEIKKVLAQRSFYLTKFVATNPEILTDIEPQDHLSSLDREIQFHSDKALVLGWDVKTDNLYIIHNLQHASTRSELLSSLATVFDPLGQSVPYCTLCTDFIYTSS